MAQCCNQLHVINEPEPKESTIFATNILIVHLWSINLPYLCDTDVTQDICDCILFKENVWIAIKFHLRLFRWVQVTLCQHWFKCLPVIPVTRPCKWVKSVIFTSVWLKLWTWWDYYDLKMTLSLLRSIELQCLDQSRLFDAWTSYLQPLY